MNATSMQKKWGWAHEFGKREICTECSKHLVGKTRYGWVYFTEAFCSTSCRNDFRVREKANGNGKVRHIEMEKPE